MDIIKWKLTKLYNNRASFITGCMLLIIKSSVFIYLTLSIESCEKIDLHKAIKEKNYEVISTALRIGNDPNEKNISGESPLIIAISQRDTLLTKILLDYDADLNITQENGQSAFELVLTAALGTDSKSAKRPNKNIDDLEHKILHLIMNKIRLKSSQKINFVGELSIAIEYKGMHNGQLAFVPNISIGVGDSSYTIEFSSLETKFFNIDRADEGKDRKSPLLLYSGGQYHVAGFKKEGIIEVTYLQLVEKSKVGKPMVIPIPSYHKSTFKAMVANTWLGQK